MTDQRIERIKQIRETLERDKTTFKVFVAISIACYLWAITQGPVGSGWTAFVAGVAMSFSALLIGISLATSELEANFLEGPRTD